MENSTALSVYSFDLPQHKLILNYVKNFKLTNNRVDTGLLTAHLKWAFFQNSPPEMGIFFKKPT